MLLGTHRFTVVYSFVLAAIFSILIGNTAYAQAPGGFMDSATSNGLRPRLSSGEIQSFLPQRGTFTFPAPYSSTGVRLTNGGDCGGADCVLPVGYSYWNNINNHVGSDTMLVFLGLERRKGGGGPTLFSYNKRSGETKNLGPMFSQDSPYSWASGEGWYFSASQPNSLYMNDGSRMLRYDVMTHAMSTVYDVNALGTVGTGKVIWQMHSSNDDRVHSATVRDGSSYAMLGCVAYDESTRLARYVAAKGDFDECQIDKSGRWLVIKENVDGKNGEDNRILDLQTGQESVFLDEDGAAGHSDVGYGYLVAEDNFYRDPGAVRVWHFGQEMSASGQGTLVYELSPGNWTSGLGHIAHSNSQNGVPLNQQMACTSNANRANLARVNEIVCYRLDGSLNALVVAPNMTDLNASGGGSEDYWKLPKGNIDVTGEYFVWTANAGTNRNDAFIVRIPQQKLGVSGGAPTPSPAPAPTTPTPAPTTPAPAPAPAPSPSVPTPAPTTGSAQWMSLINVTANGSSLQKTGGCSGCPDGTAVSQQQISSNGAVEFVASENSSLRFVGLSSGGIGTAAGDLTFAVRLQGGVAEVRESGAYKTELNFAAGDRFRISVDGGAVTYAKNGAVFYTSGNQAGSSVRVHAVFFDASSTIQDVSIGGTAGVQAPEEASAGASAPVATMAQAGYAQPRPVGQKPNRRKPRGWL